MPKFNFRPDVVVLERPIGTLECQCGALFRVRHHSPRHWAAFCPVCGEVWARSRLSASGAYWDVFASACHRCRGGALTALPPLLLPEGPDALRVVLHDWPIFDNARRREEATCNA